MDWLDRLVHWGHRIEKVKIEGEKYDLCRTCQRYVPPMPVGSCPVCHKPMKLTIFFHKDYCIDCVNNGKGRKFMKKIMKGDKIQRKSKKKGMRL